MLYKDQEGQKLMRESDREIVDGEDGMRLYTFFFEYKGGTYIYQARGRTLEEALEEWVDILPSEKIEGANGSFKQVLLAGIGDATQNNGITPIKGVLNVWCCSFLFADDTVGILTFTPTQED